MDGEYIDNNSGCCNEDVPSDELSPNRIHKIKNGLKVKGVVKLQGKNTDKVIILQEDKYMYTATGCGVPDDENPINLCGSTTSSELSPTIKSLFGDIIRSLISTSLPQKSVNESKVGERNVLHREDESTANDLLELTSVTLHESTTTKTSRGYLQNKLSLFTNCFGESRIDCGAVTASEKQETLSEVFIDGDLVVAQEEKISSVDVDDLNKVTIHSPDINVDRGDICIKQKPIIPRKRKMTRSNVEKGIAKSVIVTILEDSHNIINVKKISSDAESKCNRANYDDKTDEENFIKGVDVNTSSIKKETQAKKMNSKGNEFRKPIIRRSFEPVLFINDKQKLNLHGDPTIKKENPSNRFECNQNENTIIKGMAPKRSSHEMFKKEASIIEVKENKSKEFQKKYNQ